MLSRKNYTVVAQKSKNGPRAVFATIITQYLFPKRHAYVFKESQSLFFVFGGSDDCNGKTKNIFDFLVGSFRENSVFFDRNGHITDIINAFPWNALPVFGSRQRYVKKFIQKRKHPVSAQGYKMSNNIALA